MSEVLNILPTPAAVAAHSARRLAANSLLLGGEAVTLRGLAEEICAASRSERRPLSASGRTLLFRALLNGPLPEDLAVIAAFPGFSAAAEGVVAELRQARLSSVEFDTLVRKAGGGRLLGLAELYARYRRELDRLGLFDPDGAEEEALRLLEAGSPLPRLLEGRSLVRVTDIHDFTPLQVALLAELSRRVPVEIRLTYDFDRSGLLAAAGRAARDIETLDDPDLRIDLSFQEPEERFLLPMISFLESKEGEKREAVPGAALFSAPGMYRECEEIGRRIRRRIEAGVDPASIGVVVRDLTLYGPMLEDVCRRFRIPVSYRRGGALRTSPLIATILAPFDIVRSRFAREEIVTLLKSTYGSFIPRDLHPDAVEQAILAAGYIDAGRSSLEEALERRIVLLGEKGEREARVLAGLRPFLGEVRLFAAPRTLLDFINLVEEFAARHGLYSRALDAGDLRALKRDVSAVAQLRELLAELKRDITLLGLEREEVAPEDFASILLQAMEGKYLGGERTPGVAILTFHEVRGLSFGELFIAGLNDGMMPPRHEPHPLLKEEEKRDLARRAGRRLFPTLRERGAEEPLLFALGLSAARNSLTLSYSSMDGTGGALIPSFLLEQAGAALGLTEERIAIDAVIPEPGEALEEEELLNSLARDRRLVESLPPANPLAEMLERVALAGRIEAERTGGSGGRFGRDEVAADLREWFRLRENRFPPTALEEFGSCPFGYFARRLLRLQPVEKPADELDPREEGSVVHEILLAFYRRMAAEGRLPLTGAADEERILREEGAEVFRRHEEEHGPEPLLWEAEKDGIMEMLSRFVAAEGADNDGFLPVAFEEELPPLELEVGGERVSLRGKIDRLDVDRAGGSIRIIDYKTGSDETRYASLLKRDKMGKTSFQMPTYLLAAARRIEEETGTRPAGLAARYAMLRKAVGKELSAEGAEWENFLAADPELRRGAGEDNFLNRVETTIGRILAGDFTPEPEEAGLCRYCDFGTVCRFTGETKGDEE